MRSLFDKVLDLFFGLVLVVMLASPPSVQAQVTASVVLTPEQLEKIHAGNDKCLACHSIAGIAHPPVAGMDLKKLRTLIPDAEAFYASDHQRLACTKCHNEGYDEFPHAADATDNTTTCSDCHSKSAAIVEKQFDKSVHADLGEKFTCTTCHNPHTIRIAKNMTDTSRVVAQDNRVCLGCHDSDEQFAKFAPEKKSRPLIDDIHSWLPNTRLHWKHVRCVECHTAPVATGEQISHEIFNKDKAEKKCLACHQANSSLKTSLYRHLVTEEQQRLGFVNSIILADSYVIGATHHPVLDTLILIAFGAMFLGLLAHGIGRIVVHIMQRRKNNG